MHSAGAQNFLFDKYNITVEPNLLDSEYENRYMKAAFGNVWSWHAAVLIHQCGRSQDDIVGEMLACGSCTSYTSRLV